MRARSNAAAAWLFPLLLGGACLADEGWTDLNADGLTLRVPSTSPAKRDALLDTLVTLRNEVAARLGHLDVPTMTVYVAGSDEDFNTLTRNRIPHWGAGVAYPEARTIVLRRRAGQLASLLQTARHEFSHIVLHHALADRTSRVPVWFNEGVAMWVAREWRLRQSLEVAAAAFSGGLIPLGEIDSVLSFGSGRARLAYDQSYLATLYIVELGGPAAIARLVSDLRDGTRFDVALYRVTGVTPDTFEAGFASFVSSRYGAVSLLTAEEALWIYIVLLVIVVWVGVRVRNRRTLSRWEAEDPLEGLPLRLRAKISRARIDRERE